MVLLDDKLVSFDESRFSFNNILSTISVSMFSSLLFNSFVFSSFLSGINELIFDKIVLIVDVLFVDAFVCK